jgi:Amt family ammonium transporter
MVDHLWVLFSAALVFLMQAGFMCFEAGVVPGKTAAHVALKNLVDWVVLSLSFFVAGFGLMFGASQAGWIGTSDFFLTDVMAGKGHALGLTFVLFQMAFSGTALTIVSGAMSGRTGFVPYLLSSLLMSILIYPVFGHWAWGNLFNPENKPWLASLGFLDFAGSTVVHSVGAWFALVGVLLVGPRIGRFTAEGNVVPMKAGSYPLAILGVIILWFGWWGFNGGSTLALNADVARIILVTNLSACAAALSAFFHAVYLGGKRDLKDKMLGGTLTGLVAITAGCNVISPLGAIAVGLIAGVIHNLAFDALLYRFKIDDPVGAIPVHGAGGVFGTLVIPVFADASLLPHDRLTQFGVQLAGVVTAFLFVSATAWVSLMLIKKTIGLRVSPDVELGGLQLEDEFGVSKQQTEAGPGLTPEELELLMK